MTFHKTPFGKKVKNSSNDDTHPYLRLSFWINSSNHYWGTEFHTNKSKDYHSEWLQGLVKREKRLTSLNIK